MTYHQAAAFVRHHARKALRFSWNVVAVGMVGMASWWMLGLPWAERECSLPQQHWIIEGMGMGTAAAIYAVWLTTAVLIVTYIGAALARRFAP